MKVIRCGKFFSAADESVRENMAIFVEGNAIRDIKPGNEAKSPAGSECEEIDLSGCFVMPGLIDCHMHMNLNG